MPELSQFPNLAISRGNEHVILYQTAPLPELSQFPNLAIPRGMNMSFSAKLLPCLLSISPIVRGDTAQFHITLQVYQLYNVVNYTLRNLYFSEIARQAAQIKLLRKLQKQEQARVAKEAKKQQGRRFTCIERWDLGIPSLPSSPEFL